MGDGPPGQWGPPQGGPPMGMGGVSVGVDYDACVTVSYICSVVQ